MRSSWSELRLCTCELATPISRYPYTTDADLVLAPDLLTDEPHIEELMRGARFSQEGQPGSWIRSVAVGGRSVNIPVDLMFPEGLAPPGGSRGARIEPHDKMAARKNTRP
jgi:hypothetical protein